MIPNILHQPRTADTFALDLARNILASPELHRHAHRLVAEALVRRQAECDELREKFAEVTQLRAVKAAF